MKYMILLFAILGVLFGVIKYFLERKRRLRKYCLEKAIISSKDESGYHSAKCIMKNAKEFEQYINEGGKLNTNEKIDEN